MVRKSKPGEWTMVIKSCKSNNKGDYMKGKVNKYNTKSGKRVSMPESDFKKLKLQFDIVDIAFIGISLVVGFGIGLLF